MTQPVQQVKQPVYRSVLPTLFVPITKDTHYYPLAALATFIVIQSIESSLLTPNITAVGLNGSLRLSPRRARKEQDKQS